MKGGTRKGCPNKYCRRGHVMAKTAVVLPNGDRLCGICYDQYKAKAKIKAAKKYKENIQARTTDNKNRYLKRVCESLKVTEEELDNLLKIQDNKCTICRQSFTETTITGSKRHKTTSIRVDHDHTTGKLRGLICGLCNTGLGMFRDNTTILRAAIRYLEASAEVKEIQGVTAAHVIHFAVQEPLCTN